MTAEVNAKDCTDYTPLHYAAEEGHAGVARLLIGNGAEINAKTNWQEDTPHSLATYNSRRENIANIGYTDMIDLLNEAATLQQPHADRVKQGRGTGKREIG